MKYIRKNVAASCRMRCGIRAVADWLPAPGPLIHTFSWMMFALIVHYIFRQWSLDGWQSVSPLAFVLAIPYLPFVLFLCTGLVVHELGHAVAARLVGMRVFEIVIGTFGETLCRYRIGGVVVEIKRHPLDGYVLASHRSLQFLRLRDTVMTLGGPIANAVMGAAALWVQQQAQLSYWSLEGGLLLFIGVTNLLRALFSLYPREMTMGFGTLPSDGLALIRTPFLSFKERQELHADYYLREGLAARDVGDSTCCLRWLERGLREYPQHVGLKTWSGVVCLETNRCRQAHGTFRELLARSDLEESERLQSCVYLVWTNLTIGDPQLLLEADTASQTAMQIAPDDLASQYARGSLLIQLDRLDEGLPMLQAAVAADSVPVHKAVGISFLAMGFAKRCNLIEARRQLDLARTLDPHCVFLVAAEKTIFTAENASADPATKPTLELSTP